MPGQFERGLDPGVAAGAIHGDLGGHGEGPPERVKGTGATGRSGPACQSGWETIVARKTTCLGFPNRPSSYTSGRRFTQRRPGVGTLVGPTTKEATRPRSLLPTSYSYSDPFPCLRVKPRYTSL